MSVALAPSGTALLRAAPPWRAKADAYICVTRSELVSAFFWRTEWDGAQVAFDRDKSHLESSAGRGKRVSACDRASRRRGVLSRDHSVHCCNCIRLIRLTVTTHTSMRVEALFLVRARMLVGDDQLVMRLVGLGRQFKGKLFTRIHRWRCSSDSACC